MFVSFVGLTAVALFSSSSYIFSKTSSFGIANPCVVMLELFDAFQPITGVTKGRRHGGLSLFSTISSQNVTGVHEPWLHVIDGNLLPFGVVVFI